MVKIPIGTTKEKKERKKERKKESKKERKERKREDELKIMHIIMRNVLPEDVQLTIWDVR